MKHSRFSEKKVFKCGFCARSILTAILLTSIFTSCMTVTPVPPDATDREIIQMAQNAFDAGNSRAAEEYYKTLVKRYGTNINDYIIGRYELAHIYVKKKKYNLAAPILYELNSAYESSLPGQLPADYGKLVALDWNKIPQATKDEVIQKELEAEESRKSADEEAYAKEMEDYYTELQSIQDEFDSWEQEDLTEEESNAQAEK